MKQDSDVLDILGFTVDTHYRGAICSQNELFTIPDILADTLAESASFISNQLNGIQIGTLRPETAFASIATRISRELHTVLCARAKPKATVSPRACAVDVKVVSDLVTCLAAVFCGLEFDKSLLLAASSALEASGLSDADVHGALEVGILANLRPAWNTRRLIPLTEDRPIVQINSSITHVTQSEYESRRALGRRIADIARAGNCQVEVTSDYATPNTRNRAPAREDLVLAAIYRSAGMVIIADGGKFGTSTAWTLAEMLTIPVLVLARSPVDFHACRFPGRLSRRFNKVYRSSDEAVDLARAFFEDNNVAIAQRNVELAKYASVNIDSLSARVRAADPSLFDQSPLTWGRALWYASDPVLWFQAPRSVAHEVRRILGVNELDHLLSNEAGSAVALPPVPVVQFEVGAPKARGIGDATRSLLAFAEIKGLPANQISQLADAWENEVPISAISMREATVIPQYDDWDRLYLKLFGRG